MKVKDLIEELQRHDPDDRVKVEITLRKRDGIVIESGQIERVEVNRGERERVTIQAS